MTGGWWRLLSPLGGSCQLRGRLLEPTLLPWLTGQNRHDDSTAGEDRYDVSVRLAGRRGGARIGGVATCARRGGCWALRRQPEHPATSRVETPRPQPAPVAPGAPLVGGAGPAHMPGTSHDEGDQRNPWILEPRGILPVVSVPDWKCALGVSSSSDELGWSVSRCVFGRTRAARVAVPATPSSIAIMALDGASPRRESLDGLRTTRCGVPRSPPEVE